MQSVSGVGVPGQKDGDFQVQEVWFVSWDSGCWTDTAGLSECVNILSPDLLCPQCH